MGAALREEIVRRTVAVIDKPFSFQFLGTHDLTVGTEFVLGRGDDRAALGPGGCLTIRVTPDFIVEVPHGHFHLEVEQETRHIQMRIERWMAPLV